MENSLFLSLFFYLFSSVALTSALMVILSANAVYSALFLISVFFNSSLLVLLLDLEFLAVIFIIIYVGAIMVLFLLCGFVMLLMVPAEIIGISKRTHRSFRALSASICMLSILTRINNMDLKYGRLLISAVYYSSKLSRLVFSIGQSIFWVEVKRYFKLNKVKSASLWTSFSRAQSKELMPREILIEIKLSYCTLLTPLQRSSSSWSISAEKVKSRKFICTLRRLGLEYFRDQVKACKFGPIKWRLVHCGFGVLPVNISKTPVETVLGLRRDFRYGFTNVEANVINTLSAFRKISGKHRRLTSNFIANPALLKMAYTNVVKRYSISSGLKRKKLVMVSERWFIEASKQLREGSYFFRKSGGALTSKKVSTCERQIDCVFGDKIVQEAVRITLQVVFRKYLHFQKYGVACERPCYFTWKNIKKHWSDIPWYLQFQIKWDFSGFYKKKFRTMLDNYIQDAGLVSLLNKLFKAGCLEDSQSDEFVQGPSPLRLLLNEMHLVKVDLFMRKLSRKVVTTFRYLRCTDGLVVGIRGNKSLVLRIKQILLYHIRFSLFFQLEDKEIKLSHSHYEAVKLLGVSIKNISTQAMFCRNTRGLEILQRKKVALVNRIGVYKTRRYNQIRSELHKVLTDRLVQERRVDKNLVLFLQNSGLFQNRSHSKRGVLRSLVERIEKTQFWEEDFILEDAVQQLNCVLEKRSWDTYGKIFVKNSVRQYVFKKNAFEFMQSSFSNMTAHCHFLSCSLVNLTLGRSEMVRLRENRSFCDNFRIVLRYMVIQSSLKAFQGVCDTRRVSNVCFSDELAQIKFKPKAKTICVLRVYADLVLVLTRLEKIGVVNRKKLPISKNTLLSLDDFTIVTYYRTLALRLVAYYSFVDNLRKVYSFINYYLRFSLVRTLKNKHKLTVAATRQLYGDSVACSLPNGSIVSFFRYNELFALKKESLLNVPSSFDAIFK